MPANLAMFNMKKKQLIKDLEKNNLICDFNLEIINNYQAEDAFVIKIAPVNKGSKENILFLKIKAKGDFPNDPPSCQFVTAEKNYEYDGKGWPVHWNIDKEHEHIFPNFLEKSEGYICVNITYEYKFSSILKRELVWNPPTTFFTVIANILTLSDCR